ncbi:MAG: sulfate permease [Burkholderiaceae bacterium]|nr:sulfate permease [Burkholderiaceae bacterium]
MPILDWGRRYDRDLMASDLVAAVIVTIMLIPQSLAYALLAGLPAEVGIYASIAPLVVYALLGTSMSLAVGPVAVASLMTAAAAGEVAVAGSAPYVEAALVLALLSGLMLLLMGVLRLGFLATFLSHPVVSGFISASAIIIAAAQLKHILGIDAHGHDLVSLAGSLAQGLSQSHLPTLAIGAGTTVFLFWVRSRLKPMLLRIGLGARMADLLTRAGPVAAIAASTLAVWALDLDASGVRVVGEVPGGIPPLTLPSWNPALWASLAAPAFLIGVVGFVESVSVGQTLAARRRQRVDPDQELVALGASNVAAGLTGGFPVTGGFSRSVVNFDAGARTPAAGAYTAVGLLCASLFLTPALYYLPKATLAGTIVVAVLSLVDLSALRRTWAYAKADFAAIAATLIGTLLFGVEVGLVLGVGVSLALYLFRTSRPHIAEVGRVPGTEHFRNVDRHPVEVDPRLLGLRVDESLYFANARFLEDRINAIVPGRDALRHVILLCSAINEIDASALESLDAIVMRLREAGITLHLSEVKGPVMDRLRRTDFLDRFGGRVFLSHFQAVTELGSSTTDARHAADGVGAQRSN